MKTGILLIAMALGFWMMGGGEVWGQVNENFNGAALPSGWADVGSPLWNVQQCEGAGALGFNGNGDGAITPAITNPDKLNFDKKRSTTADSWSMRIEISNPSPASQTSGPWNLVTTITSISSTCSANSEVDLSSYTGLRYVRFLDNRVSGGSQRAIDNVVISVVPSGTTTISAGPASEPATISSLTNTQVGSSLNFDIDITDDEGTPAIDALDTKITQMVFTQGTGNDVGTWTTVIAGAELNDGSNSMTGIINAANITFSGIVPGLGTVADNATKTYTLKVWLKTDMGAEKTSVDGKNLVFRIQNSNMTVDASGSAFASGQDQNSGASNNAVSVVATALAFVQNATNANKNATMSPVPTVSTNDVNGNRDLDYATNVSISSTGTMTGDPVSATPSAGLATFASVVHTVSQTGRQLTATSGALSSAMSSLFDIVDASSTTDFFRSNGTGAWSTPGTWQSSPYGNDPWITATLAPNSSANTITIRSGHTITISTNISFDQTIIENDGTLQNNSAPTIANGTGEDLDCYGTFLNSGNVSWTGSMLLRPSGTYIHNTTSSSTNAYTSTTLNQGSTWIYRGTATGSLSATFSGRTYENIRFEITPANPVSLAMDGSNPLTINGNFTVENGFTLMNYMTGTNVFAGNFTNNGTINNGSGVQIYSFTGDGKSIGGTSTTTFENTTIESGSSITLNSNIAIASGFNYTVNGTLNCGSSPTITGSGSFTLASGATFQTSNTSGILGSIAVTGAKTFNAGANYEFSGATTTAFPTTAQIATFGNPNNVTVNSDITLNRDITVTGTLVLNAGKLTLGDNILTIDEAGSISGASASSYVVTNSTGTLRRIGVGGTTVGFPIGDANYYTPVTINNIGDENNFSVRFAQTTPGCFDGVQQATSVTGTWDISEDVPGGPSDCTLTIDIGSVPTGGSFTLSEAAIAHCNGGTIDYVSGTSVVGTVISGSGFTSFSPFGVGNESSLLPIELLRFEGKRMGEAALLTWLTAAEINNSHFSIEKSPDGKTFHEIGQVEGRGNSYEVNSYQFKDESPFPGLNYYRLKQVDFDGSNAYSQVVSVFFEKGQKTAVYPTIARDVVHVVLPGERVYDAALQLYDQSGRMIKTINVEADLLSFDFSVADLQAGVYILKIQGGGVLETHRILKMQ